MKESIPFSPHRLQIAREILEYLARHPEAQDSLDGIIQWWLMDQKILYQTNLVKQVVGRLVDLGILIERRNGDSRIYYRLNKSFNPGISQLSISPENLN